MQYSNRAFLLLGGNLGDRISYLNQAKALLSLHAGSPLAVSSIYETAAWGMTDQSPYLNQAVLLETSFTPEELMKLLLHIESEIGRERREKYGPRTIDIDILLFNDQAFALPAVTIPHPQLANRRFALEPLNEIAGDVIHPLLHKTVNQLLNDCTDPLPVRLYPSNTHRPTS